MKLDIKYDHPGEYLKENRLKKELSLRGLSALAGVSHTEISKVESGERENPSSSTLFKICNALDLNFYDVANLFNINPVYTKENSFINNKKNLEQILHSEDLLKKYESFALSKICSEISEIYSINLTPDKLKSKYRLSGKSYVEYLYLGDRHLTIGIDIKVISGKLQPYLLKNIKSSFADFYFHFYNCCKPENMAYFVCFVCEDNDSYEYIEEISKYEFYKFGPVLDTRLYMIND